MKKLKVLMMGGMLAAGICLFAACGTANDDGTNNGVNDTSNTQVTTQENIPGTDNTTGNGTTDNNTDAGNSKNDGNVGKDIGDMGKDVVDGVKDAGDAVWIFWRNRGFADDADIGYLSCISGTGICHGCCGCSGRWYTECSDSPGCDQLAEIFPYCQKSDTGIKKCAIHSCSDSGRGFGRSAYDSPYFA